MEVVRYKRASCTIKIVLARNRNREWDSVRDKKEKNKPTFRSSVGLRKKEEIGIGGRVSIQEVHKSV